LKKALETFNNALQIKNNSPSALNGIANVYYVKKDLVTAQKFAEQAIFSSDIETTEPYITLYNIYTQTSNYKEAQTIMERAVKAFPKDAIMNLLKAESHANGNENEKAKIHLRTALEIQPTFARAMLVLSYILIKEKNWSQVREYILNMQNVPKRGSMFDIHNNTLEKYLKAFETSLISESQVLLKGDNFAEAEKCIRLGLELNPRNTDTLLILSLSLVGQAKFENAKEELKKVMQIDPKNMKAQQMMKAFNIL